MENYTIKKPESFKKKKRVGTGPSAGGGKTCGRGMNGQMSRSGSKRRPWFEGGQMPLQRRVPKRGFNNIFRKDFQILNVSDLERFGLSEISPEALENEGFILKSGQSLKILGNGELSKAIKVTAHAFSKSAAEKIVKAGGEAIVQSKK